MEWVNQVFVHQLGLCKLAILDDVLSREVNQELEKTRAAVIKTVYLYFYSQESLSLFLETNKTLTHFVAVFTR